MSNPNEDPLPINVQDLIIRMKSWHPPDRIKNLSERPLKEQTGYLLAAFNQLPPRCAIYVPVFTYQISQELVGRVRPTWDAQCRQIIVDSLNELRDQVNAFVDRLNEVETSRSDRCDQIERDATGLLYLQARLIMEQIPIDFDTARYENGLLTPEPLATDLLSHNIKFRRDLVTLEGIRKTSFFNEYQGLKASLRTVKPTGPSRLRDDLAQQMLTTMLIEWNATIKRLREQLELMKSILDRIEWEDVRAEDEFESEDNMSVQFEAVILPSEN